MFDALQQMKSLEAPPQELTPAEAEAGGGITLCHEGFEIQVVATRNGGEVVSADCF